ncbi:hypothetical protein DVH24_011317 [Malus domestica]|uniref:Uncharacterized protein n=1 Tax=Malus domestica TaxID=3750 RepID=A0A498JZT3_MALDO|nr:hypothetical protein DVH24_011317 [Malus domestica]
MDNITGLGLDCGAYYQNFTETAVEQGKGTESPYVLHMRVGYFDGNPTFKSLDKKGIYAPENILS